jgi:rhodanese-related sulfurtransferase
MRPPSYLFGWLGVALLVFGGSFLGTRVVRTGEPTSAPIEPALVRDAIQLDDARFVTAQQVLEASAASDPAKPVMIDVRTSREFAAAHITGALNIQDFQLPDAVTTLPRGQPWVLYCTCSDDRLARWGAAAIERSGYPYAVVLQHGFQSWQEAGGPITTSGDEGAIQQGCGCSVEADAFKLWAIGRAQQLDAQPVSKPSPLDGKVGTP